MTHPPAGPSPDSPPPGPKYRGYPPGHPHPSPGDPPPPPTPRSTSHYIHTGLLGAGLFLLLVVAPGLVSWWVG